MEPEIILGPPGTGKTTTLIGMVEDELSRGVLPDRVGYVTFTRRGAEEAMDRACKKFELSRDDLPHFRTLHSLCFRQLGMSRGDVMEGKRLQDFSRFAGVRITGRVSEDGNWSGYGLGDRVLFMENLSRIRQKPLREAYDADHDDLPWSEVERVAKALRLFKKTEGLRDFTDMLVEFVESGITVSLDTLFVDEAQDLSALQWEVVKQLAKGVKRFVVAGDDDQAIYRWAGADADHLIDMPGRVRVLGQSWRVPKNVQAVANDIISAVKHRRPKEWAARDSEGSVDRKYSFPDVDVGQGEVLIMARNTYILQEQVMPELRRQGIVYEYNGHPSVSNKTLEVIQDWEALRSGKEVFVSSVRHIYEFMASGIGYKRGFKLLPKMDDDRLITMSELQIEGGLLVDTIWHEALTRLNREEMEYITAARRRGEKLLQRPRVRVATIHASKGGEAEHVVLFKEMARRTWGEMIASNREDEARVWYVAVTRAKEKLTIVESNTRHECPWL